MVLHIVAIALAIVLVAIVLVYRNLKSQFDYFEKRGITGPKPSVPFGTWWGIWNKFQGDVEVSNVKEFGKVHGTFDGKTPNLIVTEPNLVQAVLGKEAESFRNRRAQCVKTPLLQQTLLAVSNNEKQSQSKMAGSFLAHEKIRSLVPLFLQTAERLRQNVALSAKEDGGRANISQHARSYLSDTLALGVLGLDLNKSDELKAQFSKFCDCAFLNANPDSALSLTAYFYPKIASYDEIILSKEGVKFFSSLLNSAISERRSSDRHSNPVKDVLELYLEAAEDERRSISKQKDGVEELPTLNDHRVVAECLAVVLSASVYTKNLLTLAVHALATNMDIQEKLHAELSRQIHSDSAISLELIQGAKYLNMFMDEVARLYPSEFRVERVCTDSMELGKNKVEVGTIVSIPVFAIHRCEEYYPEPEVFNPERFSFENAGKRHPGTYLPYGHLGSTPGNMNVQFGIVAAKIAVAYLVMKFKFTPTDVTQVVPQFVNGYTGVLRLQDIVVSINDRN